MPLVSLIIPTYNRCVLLRQTVASALAQTYPALEIIVVDDGSTDGTVEWLASYTGRIMVVQQANQGVAAARNHGFHLAHGEYFTFLDDDDLIAPTKIARQVAHCHHHPDVGLVHCGYAKGDSTGHLLENIWLWPPADNLAQLLESNFIWMGAPLIRRDWLERVGGFDASPEHDLHSCADWDLWLRLALAGCPFATVPEPLGTYRLQPDSMVTNLARLEEELLTVLRLTLANAALPARLAAAKPLAYAQMHLWLSARGLAGGQSEAATHHLVQALHYHPLWREQPETLLPLLRGHALDARVTDPPQFMADLLAHLPGEADFLRPHQPWLMAYAHLGLALRQQAGGYITKAETEFAAALQVYPSLPHHPNDLAPFLTQYALSLPVADPVEFAAAVLSHLPIPPPAVRPILGDVALGWAFQGYFAGEERAVPRRVLAAWRYRPTLLKNRGSLAILLKSFRHQRGDHHV
ncbi:MAG: glycosyltransferase [Candidatus Promineifilaceae bacterium]